jgi:hypothetical protein
MTMDQHAQQTRERRLSAGRKRELDDLVRRVRADITSDLERLYVVDQLRESERGRPRADGQDRAAWRADAERLEWNTAKLAAEWGVSTRAARMRVRQIRP